MTINYKLNLFLFFILLSLGIFLAITGGYGSDEDTLPMIGVFETLIHSGQYMSSRFTGYPVSEIIIGFVSYFFGSSIINIIIFFSIIFGIILFYFSFKKEQVICEKFIFFILLCLTNHVIFFDNLEPIDYSLAFFFFSIGFYFLSLDKIPLAIVFFAISIGARINFALFILVTIFFYENFKKSFIDKISISISVIFSGCLFYLPIWFQSRLKLTWLTAARPIEQDFYGLIARFFYKSWQAFGVFASLLIIYFLIKNLKNIKNIKNINLCFGIITSNLLIFLYIPSELSYLQPAIIVTMYLLSQVLSKIKIYIIIFFSLFQWLTEIGFVKIKYASKDICGEVHAIGAQFQFKVFEGRYFQFQNTRGKIKCWLHDTDSLRSKNIIQGKKTRVH